MSERLDASQIAFCTAKEPDLRLLAPAGCGKTLCLLLRCMHLVEGAKGSRPRLLVVTFTVAAKQEIQSRINGDNRFQPLRDIIEVTTLNSWGFRRIKSTAFSPKLLSSKPDFHFAMLNQLQQVWSKHKAVKAVIEDNRHSAPRQLMNLMDAFKSLAFDHTRHIKEADYTDHSNALRQQQLGWRIDELYDQLIRLNILSVPTKSKHGLPAAVGDHEAFMGFFKFWRDAVTTLFNSATFTLEDQKYFAYLDERQKLEEGKPLSGAARYDHILVDEFQDINPLDLALIGAIAARSRSTVTIVGDDDQAIFEWRGATPEYILEPGKYLDRKFATYTLAVNYRSPANIVDLSQKLIAHNQRRVQKKLTASQKTCAVIQVIEVDGVTDALDKVHDVFVDACKNKKVPVRVALIGRKRAQLIPYQVYFASKDLPFCAAEDLQVFMSGAFDRLLELLFIKAQAGQRLLKTQVIDHVIKLCDLVKRYPLNKKEKEGLRQYLQSAGTSTLSAAVEALVAYRGSVKSNSDGRIAGDMAQSIRSFLGASTVSDSLLQLSQQFEGLQIDLGKAEDDIFYSDPPFLQLADFAQRYDDDFERFIEDVERAKSQLAFLPPYEDDTQVSADQWKRPLHLLTALRAKGKEFDTVVLLDVIDGIWPNRNARTPAQLEAERRVFYVAFTRAKKEVIMLVPTKVGNKQTVVSQYLGELGLDLD